MVKKLDTRAEKEEKKTPNSARTALKRGWIPLLLLMVPQRMHLTGQWLGLHSSAVLPQLLLLQGKVLSPLSHKWPQKPHLELPSTQDALQQKYLKSCIRVILLPLLQNWIVIEYKNGDNIIPMLLQYIIVQFWVYYICAVDHTCSMQGHDLIRMRTWSEFKFERPFSGWGRTVGQGARRRAQDPLTVTYDRSVPFEVPFLR